MDLSHIKSYQEYSPLRADFRRRMQEIKALRRILVGPYLNFLFENHDTMLYQVQEMVYAESIVQPAAIQHEIDTYSQMIPGSYELKATLLVEFNDPETRKVKLRELVGLQENIQMVIDRKFSIQTLHDPSQVDNDRISSVQFLTFPLGKEASEAFLQADEVQLVTSHPACSYRHILFPDQLAALKEDLSS